MHAHIEPIAGVIRVFADDDGYGDPYTFAATLRWVITDGQAEHLDAGARGSARVLWREGGTGVQWAIVRLGDQDDVEYVLADCNDANNTLFIRDDYHAHLGKVVRINGSDACWQVRQLTDEERDQCIDAVCVGDPAEVHDSCCKCAGIVKIQVRPCDDEEADPVDLLVQGAQPAVGDVIRLDDDVCYIVDAVFDCEDGDVRQSHPDLVFEDCLACQGACWDLEPCDGGESIAIRSPNLEEGMIVELGGRCYTVSQRVCDGSETEESVTSDQVYEDCEVCRVDHACTGECEDKQTAEASGQGATEGEACQAARDNAIAAARQACGSRGVDICSCESGPATPLNEDQWECWAVVCYDCCCPEGYSQVDVVTDVRCENDEIVVDKTQRCLPDDDCQDECP